MRRFTIRNYEMDRPTNNSLIFLTTVRPFSRPTCDRLIDPFVYSSLSDILGIDVIEEFGAYTRSFYTLEGHYSNLWKYDRPILPAPTDPLYKAAINRSYYAFKLDYPVKAISFYNLDDVPFIPGSASGWNYKGKKGAPGNHEKAKRMAVFNLYTWLEQRHGIFKVKDPFRYHPDIAYYRTQLSTFEAPKIRHVWGEAFDNILLEGLTAAPLINAYQGRAKPIAMGKFMFKRLPSIINSVLHQDDQSSTGVGLDFSSFDSSIQPWLIQAAFAILKSNINFPDEMTEASFDYTIEHFIRRPVVMPDGRLWLTQLGIPSGSYFTSLIGSIVNHIVISYCQLKIYDRTFSTWVCGDDSLFGIPLTYGPPKLQLFSKYAAELGLTLHPDKCITSERPDTLEFLGHTAKQIRVSRETADMMRLALYPEQPVLTPSESIARIKGLLIDSGLTNWPILHLHDLMMARYRTLLAEDQQLSTENANFLRAVLNISVLPSKLDVVRTWTLT